MCGPETEDPHRISGGNCSLSILVSSFRAEADRHLLLGHALQYGLVGLSALEGLRILDKAVQ